MEGLTCVTRVVFEMTTDITANIFVLGESEILIIRLIVFSRIKAGTSMGNKRRL